MQGTHLRICWDSTCLGALKQCPQYYKYAIIDGYVAKDENIHLRFGGEYHSAIQDYENLRANGLQFEDALRETIRLLLQSILELKPVGAEIFVVLDCTVI